MDRKTFESGPTVTEARLDLLRATVKGEMPRWLPARSEAVQTCKQAAQHLEIVWRKVVRE